jgi:hypothetical protein
VLSGKVPPEPNQVYTKSIYSFKGQERLVVVAAEIDGNIPADLLDTLLYTTLSRAKSHLILLVHEQAGAGVWDRLRGASAGQ